MSNLGIDFGLRSAGGGIDSTRLREQREELASNRTSGAGDSKASSFGDFLKNMVEETNASAIVADQKMQEVAAGRNKDLHGAVLAMEKADVNFRMLSQVRNKVIEAYREIMRMQV